MVHLVYKKEGETPLAALERLCRDHGIYEKVTYAGRLDPMASGLLLVLSGDDVHKKDSMLEHTKTYDFTILLGVATDTGDILGKVTEVATAEMLSESKYKKIVESFKKTYKQPYPLYSSKTVDGKPLWTYAREGIKPDVVPTHSVTISRCVLNNVETISGAELLQQIHERIEKVVGDFRQGEILKLWGKSVKAESFILLNCTADVSSGTYIRQLAVDIGVKLGIPALAYNIVRTQVGPYSVENVLPEL